MVLKIYQKKKTLNSLEFISLLTIFCKQVYICELKQNRE